MSILIPIHDDFAIDITTALVFAGNTELVIADSDMVLAGRVNFLGNTLLEVGIGLEVTGEVHLDGGTALSVRGRLNDEADTFGEIHLDGATTLEIAGGLALTKSVRFAGDTALVISGAQVFAPTDLTLAIFVDIEDSAVSTAQSAAANLRRYHARLLVDGTELPIRKASLSAAKESMGLQLQVTMATPNFNQIGLNATVVFQLGIWSIGDAAFHYVTLLSGGKLSARSKSVRNDQGLPADEVSCTIVDVVGDRWNRAPRVPLHFYNPFKVATPHQSGFGAGTVQAAGAGEVITTHLPVPNLDLKRVLREAYITGAGYAEIISNVPNFPVDEVSFTLDGGYDAGARPLLGLFGPLFFADEFNRLFIVDPDAPLPAGFVPRLLTVSQFVDLSDQMPQRPLVNSMVVSIKDESLGGDYSSPKRTVEISNSGIFGDPGWTETTVTKDVNQFFTFLDPTTVVREEDVAEVSETIDYQFNPMERSEVLYKYDNLGRKTGFKRKIARKLPDPENGGEMTLMADASVQDQIITYTTNPLNPFEDVQDTCTTVDSGFVLVDKGNEYLGKPYKIPLSDAHRSGYVNQDQPAEDPDQTLIHQTIKTTIESLRVRGQQITTETRVIDHVSNVTTQNSITERPGAITIDRRAQTASRMILITVPGTTATGRRAATFNTGDLPFDIGMNLAKRTLKRLNSPPRDLAITPAYPDLSIRRGSTMRVQTRGGSVLGDYIVMAYEINYDESSGSSPAKVAMNLTTRELLPA